MVALLEEAGLLLTMFMSCSPSLSSGGRPLIGRTLSLLLLLSRCLLQRLLYLWRWFKHVLFLVRLGRRVPLNFFYLFNFVLHRLAVVQDLVLCGAPRGQEPAAKTEGSTFLSNKLAHARPLQRLQIHGYVAASSRERTLSQKRISRPFYTLFKKTISAEFCPGRPPGSTGHTCPGSQARQLYNIYDVPSSGSP